MIRHPLPSTGSPEGRDSPASTVIWNVPNPCRPSRVTSLPSLGGTTRALSLRSHRHGVRRRGPGAFAYSLRLPLAGSGVETTGPPRFLGNPRVRALLFDPGGTETPGHTAPPCCLPRPQRCRLPQTGYFRGSITQPTHSLCTLRSAGYPNTTQHSLPAAGQALPGGIGYPLGPNERFQPIIASPFPRLRLAQAGWPWVIAHPGLPQIRTCAIDAYGSSYHGFAT
jgi:hypothetical protein